MRTMTKIACRTIGTLGMGIALYDATRVAKHHARATGENCKAAQMERAYFDSRTIDNMVKSMKNQLQTLVSMQQKFLYKFYLKLLHQKM